MQFSTAFYTLTFENPAQYPATRPYELQQVRERSAGGTIHVETFAEPLQQRMLNFDSMNEADYNGLLDFFLNRVNGMADEFDFTDERGATFRARFLQPTMNFAETSYKRWSGRLQLEILSQ